MSEKLEKFIKANRNKFDEVEPPAGLWDRIEQQLDKQQPVKPLKDRVVKLGFVLKVAAVVLVIASAGILILQNQEKRPVDISSINPELGKLQVQYAAMIEERQQEIKQVEKEDPFLYNEFSSEIRKMDTNYQKLKNELSTSPNREETVKAMIRNLQTQLDILNQQLLIIQQINQIKKGQHNDSQII